MLTLSVYLQWVMRSVWYNFVLHSSQKLIDDSGGPAGLIYGFLLIWAGTTSVFVVMGELASVVPTAGGQYHWVFLLAPKSSRKILSYVTGMSTPELTGSD